MSNNGKCDCLCLKVKGMLSYKHRATVFCKLLENGKCPSRTNLQTLECSSLQNERCSFIQAYTVPNNMPGTEEVPSWRELSGGWTNMLLAWQRSSMTSGDATWRFLPIDVLLLTYCLLLSSPECVGLFCSLNVFTDGRRKVEEEAT